MVNCEIRYICGPNDQYFQVLANFRLTHTGMAFFEGYLTGLALIIFIGPVFFTLLQSTLEHGLKSGLSVALGIFSSDVLCVLLLFGFGASDFFTNPNNELLIGVGGAIILIGLGVSYAVKPVLKSTHKKMELKTPPGFMSFFVKGFLINFVNPFVFVVWMGLIAIASKNQPSVSGQGIFLMGTLLGILTSDSIKASLANYIKDLLQPKFLAVAYRVIGVTLIIFGVRMLFMVSGVVG